MKDLVLLRSCDGAEFEVDEKTAAFSEILTILLDRSSPFEEAASRIINLPIKARFLRRAIEYLEYKSRHHKAEGPIPDFDVNSEESLDLLSIAFYLKI